MRFAVLLLLAPLLKAQGEVEGKVVNSITGAGIDGVQVEITLADSKAPSYRAVTDSAGEFRLSAVSEGAYTVTYKKPGFAGTEYDRQSPFTQSGPIPVHLRRQLDPLTVLSGRTAAHISVELITAYGQVRKSVPTDAHGDFRIEDLLPGSYLLRANPNRAAQASLEVQPASSGEEKRVLLAPAYYPGVADRTQASVINARGGELTGYDIRLRPSPVFRIAGRLLDVQGKPLPHFSVELVSADAWNIDARAFPPPLRAAREAERTQISSAGDGSFEFANISPGNWHLVAGSACWAFSRSPSRATTWRICRCVLQRRSSWM
jgi:protocatechuate 3,4-dioxygenase beta subunit